jgi:hypothetical protein
MPPSDTNTAARPNSTGITLDDYADDSRWVAWRQDWKVNEDGTRTKTKVPYDPNNNRKAQVPANPDTFGTLREAETRWPTLRARAVDGVGGVGIARGDAEGAR